MLERVGVGVFHDGIVARGICHEEMVAGLLLVHTHIILLKHSDSLLNGGGAVEQHTHGHGGEDGRFVRILLFGGQAVQLEYAHCKSIFVDTVKQQIG